MRLFQDAAGTIPATLPGQPVGLVKRMAGTADASQATALSRPTLARWPKGGRRNLLTWTEDFSNAAWEKSSGVTVTPSADGFTIVDRASGTIDRRITRRMGTVTDEASYTFTIDLLSGSHNTAIISIFCSGYAPSRTTVELLSGPATVTNTSGYATVSNLSASVPSRVRVTRQIVVGDFGNQLQVLIFPVNASDTPGSILIRHPQVELGSVSTPYQSVTTQYDITETGVPDVWHLSNDGGDSLSVALPAGTYGRAVVNAAGVVTVDTVVDPTNALVSNQQVDIILRQGAFTSEEEAKIRAYWARYAA